MLGRRSGTFALVYTVLNVATAPALPAIVLWTRDWIHRARSMPLPSERFRGRVQPSRRYGVSLLGLANGSNLWMYWFSEFLGARVRSGFLSRSKSGKTARAVSSLPR